MKNGSVLSPAGSQAPTVAVGQSDCTVSAPGGERRMMRLRTYLAFLVVLVLAPALLLGAATIC